MAISKTVQERIRKIYGRHSEIIYPGIDCKFFRPLGESRENFYLIVAALVPQKRIDLAIEAFNHNHRPLRIVGTGPLYRRLKHQAGPNIKFLGWLPDQDLRRLYSQALALVFPGTEDFGLVPVEAQACGCPVIAYADGGVKESVVLNGTGIFFRTHF